MYQLNTAGQILDALVQGAELRINGCRTRYNGHCLESVYSVDDQDRPVWTPKVATFFPGWVPQIANSPVVVMDKLPYRPNRWVVSPGAALDALLAGNIIEVNGRFCRYDPKDHRPKDWLEAQGEWSCMWDYVEYLIESCRMHGCYLKPAVPDAARAALSAAVQQAA